MRQIITSLRQTFGAIATQLVQHQSREWGQEKANTNLYRLIIVFFSAA